MQRLLLNKVYLLCYDYYDCETDADYDDDCYDLLLYYLLLYYSTTCYSTLLLYDLLRYYLLLYYSKTCYSTQTALCDPCRATAEPSARLKPRAQGPVKGSQAFAPR